MLVKVIDHLEKKNYINKIYKGYVVDNIDPDELNRIKCKVENRIESDDNSKLPWCFPLNPYGQGGRPDLSSFSIPEIDTEVSIEFIADDIYTPFYTGYWQSESTSQNLLFGEDYPNSYGFIDSVIEWFRINKSKPYLEFFRQTLEDLFRIDEDGNFWFNIPKSLIINVAEDLNFKIGNNLNVEVLNDSNLKTANNISIQSSSNFDLDVGSKIRVTSGADLNLKSGANFNNESSSNFSVKAGTDYKLQGTNVYLKADVDLGEEATNQSITCLGNQGILATGLMTHKAAGILHNGPPPTPIPAVPPDTAESADMSNLDSGITDLTTEITNLETKLSELKALADQIESKRDQIKQKFQEKSETLKGD